MELVGLGRYCRVCDLYEFGPWGPCPHQLILDKEQEMAEQPNYIDQPLPKESAAGFRLRTGMTMNGYQAAAMRTQCNQVEAGQRIVQNSNAVHLLHSVIGLMGELGEMAGALEKWLWYGQEFDEVNFKEELGDAAWYLAEGADGLCMKLRDILEANIVKLRTRFPEKYSDELAAEKNRDRAAERRVLEEAKPSTCRVTTIDHTGRQALEPQESPASIPQPGDPYPTQHTQTGQGWAEPPEPEGNAGFVPEFDPTLYGLAAAQIPKPLPSEVEAAIEEGWSIVVGQRCGEMTGQNFLVLPGDMSEKWAANWCKVCIKDPKSLADMWIWVPHWLRKRRSQIAEEKASEDNSGVEEVPQVPLLVPDTCRYCGAPWVAKFADRATYRCETRVDLQAWYPADTCIAEITQRGFILARQIADTYLDGKDRERALQIITAKGG